MNTVNNKIASKIPVIRFRDIDNGTYFRIDAQDQTAYNLFVKNTNATAIRALDGSGTLPNQNEIVIPVEIEINILRHI
jgi:hypothetical protein